MRVITSDKIEQAVYELAKNACLHLTPACTKALQDAQKREDKICLDMRGLYRQCGRRKET